MCYRWVETSYSLTDIVLVRGWMHWSWYCTSWSYCFQLSQRTGVYEGTQIDIPFPLVGVCVTISSCHRIPFIVSYLLSFKDFASVCVVHVPKRMTLPPIWILCLVRLFSQSSSSELCLMQTRMILKNTRKDCEHTRYSKYLRNFKVFTIFSSTKNTLFSHLAVHTWVEIVLFNI